MTMTRKGTTGWIRQRGTTTTAKNGFSQNVSHWVSLDRLSPAKPSMAVVGAFHDTLTGMKCVRVVVDGQEASWTLEATYEGTEYSSDPLPTSTYELDISTSEEPIETHPNFSTFATEANGAKWDDNDGSFVGFVKMPIWNSGAPDFSVANPDWVGVRSYLSVGATARAIDYVRGGTSIDLTAIGKIGVPPVVLASIPSGMNWLYVGANIEERGSVFTIKREWRLSGPRGWNASLYS